MQYGDFYTGDCPNCGSGTTASVHIEEHGARVLIHTTCGSGLSGPDTNLLDCGYNRMELLRAAEKNEWNSPSHKDMVDKYGQIITELRDL